MIQCVITVAIIIIVITLGGAHKSSTLTPVNLKWARYKKNGNNRAIGRKKVTFSQQFSKIADVANINRCQLTNDRGSHLFGTPGVLEIFPQRRSAVKATKAS